jgi:hypothetical protein
LFLLLFVFAVVCFCCCLFLLLFVFAVVCFCCCLFLLLFVFAVAYFCCCLFLLLLIFAVVCFCCHPERSEGPRYRSPTHTVRTFQPHAPRSDLPLSRSGETPVFALLAG